MTNYKYSLPSLNAILVFESAARLGGFTKAAQELNINQPNVSAHIKNLEQWLGTSLFVRKKNKIILTQEGANFYKQVVLGFKELERGVNVTKSNGEKIITLSCTFLFYQMCILDRYYEILEAIKPYSLNLNLVKGTHKVDREADFYISYENVNNIDSKSIIVQEITFPICSPKFLEENPELLNVDKNPEILLKYNLLYWQGVYKSNMWSSWKEWFAFKNIEYEYDNSGIYYTDYIQTLEDVVNSKGVAIGYVPMVNKYIAENKIVKIGDSLKSDEMVIVLNKNNKYIDFDLLESLKKHICEIDY